MSQGSVAAREASHFDRWVAEAGDFDPLEPAAWSVLTRRFGEAVEGLRELSIIDVGCGTGRSRQIYAASAATYAGIDLSLGALRVARARDAGSWLRGDACRLPFATHSADVVAFSSVLHHIPGRRAALAEARRVLRRGGMVFAFDPNLRHPAMALFRHPSSPFYRREGVSADERPVSPSELRRDFDASGYVAIRQRCQSNLPYRAVGPKGLNAMLPLFNLLDSAWERIGLGRFFGSFVITWARTPSP
jgi:SAM-dependent methyltransferase